MGPFFREYNIIGSVRLHCVSVEWESNQPPRERERTLSLSLTAAHGPIFGALNKDIYVPFRAA